MQLSCSWSLVRCYRLSFFTSIDFDHRAVLWVACLFLVGGGTAFDLAFGALFSKVYRVRWVVANVTSGRGRARNKRRSFLPVVGGEKEGCSKGGEGGRLPVVYIK